MQTTNSHLSKYTVITVLAAIYMIVVSVQSYQTGLYILGLEGNDLNNILPIIVSPLYGSARLPVDLTVYFHLIFGILFLIGSIGLVLGRLWAYLGTIAINLLYVVALIIMRVFFLDIRFTNDARFVIVMQGFNIFIYLSIVVVLLFAFHSGTRRALTSP